MSESINVENKKRRVHNKFCTPSSTEFKWELSC